MKSSTLRYSLQDRPWQTRCCIASEFNNPTPYISLIFSLTDSQFLSSAQDLNLPEINPAENVLLMGAPLSAGHNLDPILESKRLDLQRLSKRLELIPPQDRLYFGDFVLQSAEGAQHKVTPRADTLLPGIQRTVKSLENQNSFLDT